MASWKVSWWIISDLFVTLAQWKRARLLTEIWVIRRCPVQFWPKPRKLKSIWIWANRPSIKGSKLLFLKWNQITHTYICCLKNRYVLEESDNIWQNHSIWQYTTKLDKIRQNTKQTYDNNVETCDNTYSITHNKKIDNISETLVVELTN